VGVTREHRLLMRYRLECESFMESLYDVELLRAHMKRNHIDEPRQASLDLLLYELRKRIKRFHDIEPARYNEVDKRLADQYEVRDQLNAQAAGRKRAARKNGDHG
jgi:hypothetical protein